MIISKKEKSWRRSCTGNKHIKYQDKIELYNTRNTIFKTGTHFKKIKKTLKLCQCGKSSYFLTDPNTTFQTTDSTHHIHNKV